MSQRTKPPNPSAANPHNHQKHIEKTHTHTLLLLQSPLWILPVLYIMHTGILRTWSDPEYLVFSLTIASPSLLLPYLFCSPPPDYKTRLPYWLKLNTWIFILVCFGTYFGTHYFFDLMGMRYAFGGKWHLESDVLGQHGCGKGERQTVPVFMYPLTHAYFVTYFCLLVEGERGVLWGLGRIGVVLGGGGRGRGNGGMLSLRGVGRGLVVLGLGYGLAFAETYVMGGPLLEDLFLYEDRGRMLRVGSLGYAAYFVVGLPMVKRIDGEGEEDWGMGRVVIEALGASMGIMVLLEVWAKVVGPL